MNQIFASFTLILFSAQNVLAAGGHGAHGEVPTKTIIYQAINVGLMVIGLIYVLRKPVKEYFQNKRSQFLSHAEKSQAALRAAEAEKAEIQKKLNHLQSTTEESISRAKADAADLRNQLTADADLLSRKIQKESREAAQREIERAKNEVRTQMIAAATKAAQDQLGGRLSGDEHQRLQGQFIDGMKTVQS